jgi:hypothetical protein
MKRIFLISMLFLAVPSWAAWTVVQHNVKSCLATSATCAITVASTGTGNVIAIGMSVGNNTDLIVSVSGGGTFTHPATACHAVNSTTRGSDCAYTLASTSGATSITVTRTAAVSAWQIGIAEYSFTSSPVSLDTGTPQIRTQASAVTSCPGVALTLAGTNDVIFQIDSSANPSSISTPFLFISDFSGNGGGYASSINTIGGAAPTWTQSSAASALSAIAFTETGGAPTPVRVNKRKKLEKLQSF